MEEALKSLLHRSRNELAKADKNLRLENAKLPKKPRIEKRPPTSGIQLHMFQNGYQLVRGDSKQSSSLIPYSNKDILEEVSAGRIPLSITSWLESDKLLMKNGELEVTVVERGSSGNVLSSETLTLYHCNTALESQQILNETRQIYRWSDKDRLILDSCLSLATSDPLCLEPNPIVHLIQNRASRNPFQRENSSFDRRHPSLSTSASVPPIDRSSLHPGVKTNHDRQNKNQLQVAKATLATSTQPTPPLPDVPVVKMPAIVPSSNVSIRREIQIKSQLGRSSQLVTIEIIRDSLLSGYSGKALCQQLTPTGCLSPGSVVSHEFEAASPREAELLAQQYVMLYCNNSPRNATITVTEGETVEDHENPDSFPEWILIIKYFLINQLNLMPVKIGKNCYECQY